ncbi:hypothetical protein [Bacillus sp. SM2101]|uniref:hypothetical protein n=1 Tax=Bacillus sp. SM2101 TaxID=2805366 RepID=UPI001BDDD811|nr:hypothetical protein [Bacillus sp. SM2101]
MNHQNSLNQMLSNSQWFQNPFSSIMHSNKGLDNYLSTMLHSPNSLKGLMNPKDFQKSLSSVQQWFKTAESVAPTLKELSPIANKIPSMFNMFNEPSNQTKNSIRPRDLPRIAKSPPVDRSRESKPKLYI